jgi:hypothetical protein
MRNLFLCFVFLIVLCSTASAQYYCGPYSYVYPIYPVVHIEPAYTTPIYTTPVYTTPVVRQVWHEGYWENVKQSYYTNVYHEGYWTEAPANYSEPGYTGPPVRVWHPAWTERVRYEGWTQVWRPGYWVTVSG